MNIYDDYGNYMEDVEEILTKLKNTSSYVMFCLDDVINVLDYIYRKYLDKVKIDNELEELFEVGFGYLSNALNDIKTYYEEYFKQDIVLFNKYASLIVYSILIDDLKAYLLGEEKLSKQKEKNLDRLLLQIDNILINNKEIKGSLLFDIEDTIDEYTPNNNDYKPVYAVFSMIAEELGIY